MRWIIGIILGILFFLGVVFICQKEISMNLAGGALMGLVGAYLIFSFGTIDGKKGEIGALFYLGEPVENLVPGWYFAPVGLMSVRKEKGTVFQDELPSDPENIYRGDGLPPVGKFPPIRVKFGPHNPLDTDLINDPYDIEGVEEVAPVVAWKIINLVTFSLVVGDNANCRKMLSDKTVQIVGGDLATMTPAKASKELDTINQKIVEGLQKDTKGWGIEINQAYMKPFIYSHSLNKSVEAVSLARETAKATVLAAEGEKNKRIAEATGAAEAVKLAAAAEQERLVKTGLAKVNANGDIIELLPDANTRVRAEALKELAKVTGTLVLGDTNTMLGINKNGGEK